MVVYFFDDAGCVSKELLLIRVKHSLKQLMRLYVQQAARLSPVSLLLKRQHLQHAQNCGGHVVIE